MNTVTIIKSKYRQEIIDLFNGSSWKPHKVAVQPRPRQTIVINGKVYSPLFWRFHGMDNQNHKAIETGRKRLVYATRKKGVAHTSTNTMYRTRIRSKPKRPATIKPAVKRVRVMAPKPKPPDGCIAGPFNADEKTMAGRMVKPGVHRIVGNDGAWWIVSVIDTETNAYSK